MAEEQPLKCRHCKVNKAQRNRGLCNRCYLTPAIRALYPAVERTGMERGIEDFNGNPTGVDPLATDTFPGSKDRVAAMQRRAEAGQSLYHPEDYKPNLE